MKQIVDTAERAGDKSAQGLSRMRNGLRDIASASESSARSSGASFSKYFSADFFAGLARDAAYAFGRKIVDIVSTSIDVAKQAQSALSGLNSIAVFRGIDTTELNNSIRDLEAVRRGLLTQDDARAAVKPLLQMKLEMQDAIAIVDRYTRTAAFGRQATLGYGEAIIGATEGLKNTNAQTLYVRVSRKKLRGGNRRKAVQLLAKQHLKVKRQRHDFFHKRSLDLLREFDAFAFESLNIAGMVKITISPKVLRTPHGIRS